MALVCLTVLDHAVSNTYTLFPLHLDYNLKKIEEDWNVLTKTWKEENKAA